MPLRLAVEKARPGCDFRLIPLIKLNPESQFYPLPDVGGGFFRYPDTMKCF
jgi:hypothetical protein